MIINKYFLYRHIRLDKNEPFYIGIGRKRLYRNIFCWTNEYERAYDKCKQRSQLWNRIADKGYEVEIIFETDDHDSLLKKEKEFIKLYGRIDLKNGTLANMTDGGEGINNLTPETRKKISDGQKNKIVSEETKNKIREKRKLQIMVPWSEETINSLSERRKGPQNPMFGKTGSLHHLSKAIYQYTLNGEFIRDYVSAREVQKLTGISYKTISEMCRHVRKKILKKRDYVFSFVPLSFDNERFMKNRSN